MTCPRCRYTLCTCDVVTPPLDLGDVASVLLVVVGLVAGLIAVFR